MAKKEFSYRGKTIAELKEMDTKEFAKLVPTRQRRTLLRGHTDQQKRFIQKLENNKDNIKTHARDVIVTPIMLDKTIKVHTGKEFVTIMIQPEMLGHRLGEFAMSKRKVAHSTPGVGATKSSSSVSVR